ncbi:MAG: S8 family serine peptidase [Chloroflexota bacterium]|nr:S8 family serine peptidase [Chloroflexota bacterium]
MASSNQIADGINWAWRYANSDVINNSWGGGAPSDAITNAIRNALSQGRGGSGTVVVFAAGNTSDRRNGHIGSVQYPATLSSTTDVISVGAINRHGDPANYTPDGRIDVVAPSGHDTRSCVGEVVTIDRYGSPGCNDGPNEDFSYTRTFSGTSAAAPQVSGVAALMLSYTPSLTASQVKSRLRGGADSWGSSTMFGAGKLNAYRALTGGSTGGGGSEPCEPVPPQLTC